MRPILPAWTESDPALHARLGAAIDPERKVLGALERIVSLSGKRIADVGTGIGHYPMLLARRTGRTYGIESDPELLAEARRRVVDAHQPNIRIIEGSSTSLPLRDEAVDVVLTSLIDPDDGSLPAVAEALTPPDREWPPTHAVSRGRRPRPGGPTTRRTRRAPRRCRCGAS